MNIAKIAHYYPAYCDILRLGATAGRDSLNMMENLLRAELLLASPQRYSIALCNQDEPAEHFDYLGMPTYEAIREFVPCRVQRWATRQLPVTYSVSEIPPTAGWLVSLCAGQRAAVGVPGQPLPATPRVPSEFAYYQGGLNEVLPLLRGLEAYQRKRRKRARKLLAQLWVYHWQQQPASGNPVARVAGQKGGQVA